LASGGQGVAQSTRNALYLIVDPSELDIFGATVIATMTLVKCGADLPCLLFYVPPCGGVGRNIVRAAAGAYRTYFGGVAHDGVS
jgi:hypothetical protein